MLQQGEERPNERESESEMTFEQLWERQQYTDDPDDKEFALFFYRAAFNAGLEAGANKCESQYEEYDGSVYPCFDDADECAAAIRALKQEQS